MDKFNAPSLKELLDAGAEKWNDSPFLKYVKNGEVVSRSFIQVRSDSNAVCRFIRSTVSHKTNVAIIGKTSYEYLIYFSGVLLSGNVGIPFSPEISAKEASELFTRADIEMLFYENEFAERAEELKKSCPSLKYLINIDSRESLCDICDKYSDTSEYAQLSEIEVDKDECAVIIFTSGTTGVKKGVMLSTNALIGNIMYHDYCTDVFTENDVSLSVLPMYHVYCFSGDYIKNLKDGVQVALNGSMKDLIFNLKTFQPKVMRVVPMIAQSLLQRVRMTEVRNPSMTPREAAEQVYGKNIEWIISGGAYLNPELVTEYAKYGITIRQGYGMTEAGCRISVPDNEVSYESVGRVTDVCEVRIRNGEIQVNTPTRMLGYYNMPEESEEMFTEDGWLRTGDIGYVTEDNQLFVTGRVKNLIILSGGENVSPEAIEKKFGGIDLIKEILVYAEKDKIVAEIYPDFDYANTDSISDIEAALEGIVDEMNETAKASHIISKIKIRETPFEKTGAGKIKRKVTKI